MRVQLDSNTDHWNTDLYEVRLLNGPEHWKTKILASLDHLIQKHNFSYKMAKAIQKVGFTKVWTICGKHKKII